MRTRHLQHGHRLHIFVFVRTVRCGHVQHTFHRLKRVYSVRGWRVQRRGRRRGVAVMHGLRCRKLQQSRRRVSLLNSHHLPVFFYLSVHAYF